jgi:hypothetical protein
VIREAMMKMVSGSSNQQGVTSPIDEGIEEEKEGGRCRGEERKDDGE